MRILYTRDLSKDKKTFKTCTTSSLHSNKKPLVLDKIYLDTHKLVFITFSHTIISLGIATVASNLVKTADQFGL